MADYQQLIEQYARQYNVDPALISAAIQAESNWNPHAQNAETGASGLGQFIAPTAKSLGVTDPTDPNQAIPAIAKLLSQNLDRYGNPQDAIRAYHGGTDKTNWGPKTEAHVQKVMNILNQGNDDDALFNQFTKSNQSAPVVQTTPEEDALFNQFQKNEAAPVANQQAESSLIGNPIQAAQAFGHHLMNLPHGLANLIEQGVASGANYIAPNSQLAQYIQSVANQDVAQMAQREKEYQANIPTNAASVFGATAGELLPIMATGGGGLIEQLGTKGAQAAIDLGLSKGLQNAAGFGGKVLGSAGVNAVLGAAQPVMNPDNYWNQVGENAATSGSLGAASPLISPALSGLGKGAAEVLGFTSGVGPEAVKQAYRSGAEGLKGFWDNLAGNVDKSQVLEDAKFNLSKMKSAMSDAYKNGMIDISNDKKVLDFNGIDQALKDAEKYGSYKGEVVEQSAHDALGKIKEAVNHWKTLDPAEYHTPEGFDKLKQKIYNITEKIPFEEKSGRAVVNNVYNAVKGSINEQAPTYAGVMKDYSEGMDAINEINKSLSTGGKASVDTQLRKLQSVMRNNVNANYGYRTDLVKKLEQEGGRELMPSLAGQAMNSWTPRSLAAQGGALIGLGGLGTAALTGHPEALYGLAALPFESPKLIGLGAYGAGKLTSPLANMTPEQANALKLMAISQATKPIPRIEISGVPTGQ